MPIASAFRSVLRWFGFASIVLASPHAWAQSTGDGFDPNVDGNVYAVAVQPDGKILIGGSFTSLRPNGASGAVAVNNLARVLPSGLVDSSFQANVNGQVSAMVLQANGQIVIGGKFSSVNNTTRNRIARLNADGTLDAAFDPNLGGGLTPEVTSLALQSRPVPRHATVSPVSTPMAPLTPPSIRTRTAWCFRSPCRRTARS
jgi:hypothetical protein